MAYHLKGGVVFEKRPGGRVQINLSDGSGRTCLALVEAEEWASVVAAMSFHGESGEQHAAALDLHIPAPELVHARSRDVEEADRAALEAADAAKRAAEAAARAVEAKAAADKLKLPRKVQGGAEAPKAE